MPNLNGGWSYDIYIKKLHPVEILWLFIHRLRLINVYY